MARAWVYQDSKQVAKVGAANAAHYVGWIDLEGRRRCESCGRGKAGLKAAKEYREKKEADLITEKHDPPKKTWSVFRLEYEEKIVSRKAPRTRDSIRKSLSHFERIARPTLVCKITTETVDGFVTKRANEKFTRSTPKKKIGPDQPTQQDENKQPIWRPISPATANSDVRNLRAALRKAYKWGYLAKLPEFEFVREPKKVPTYVTPEHFAAIYEACKHAKFPNDLPNITAEMWWQSLMATAYLTGWRIGEIIAMRREDFSPDDGTAFMRAEDTKGRREELVPLHPIVVEHLKRVMTFDSHLFPWNHDRRMLWTEFGRIQAAARVKDADGNERPIVVPRRKNGRYAFHDLRRAFATANAARLSADQLQALMRHKSYQTTQKYIAMAGHLRDAIDSIKIPDMFAVRVAN